MAETRSDQRHGYTFPSISTQDMLAVLAAVARDMWQDAVKSGLRVDVLDDNLARFALPGQGSQSHLRAGDIAAIRGRLVGYIQSIAGTPVGPRYDGVRSIDFSRGLPLLQAAVLLADRSAAPHAVPLVLTAQDQRLVIISATLGQDAVAEEITDVTRRGRDVQLLSAEDAEKTISDTVIFLTDNAEEGGLLGGKFGRKDLRAGVYMLLPQHAGRFTLWRDHRLKNLSHDVLSQLGAIFDATRGAGAISATCTGIALLFPQEDTYRLYLVEPPALPAEDVLARQEPSQAFDFKVLRATASVEAAEKLRQRIRDLRFRLGYRVSVVSIPRDLGAGQDVEPLLREIENLNARIAQIEALGAPQLKLLRFSDRQLPAMIDGLRQLPQEALVDGSLQYTAGHAAGRDEPAHFILYNPARTHIHLAEAQWRRLTDDRPITYWLDPFVAQAHARRPARTLVFVPSGTFLEPSLAHFGSDVDGTLRLVLGDLFEQTAPIFDIPEAKPLFLFTRTRDHGLELEVEVLDRQSFAPLDIHLGWLNDYLQVRSPQIVDREKLTEIAADLYDGAVAEALRGKLQASVTDLTAAWDESRTAIRGDAEATINALITETEAAGDRIVLATDYLAEAKRRMQALETLMDEADAALRMASAAESALSIRDGDLLEQRQRFTDRVLAELQAGELAIDDAGERLATLRRKLDRILAESDLNGGGGPRRGRPR